MKKTVFPVWLLLPLLVLACNDNSLNSSKDQNEERIELPSLVTEGRKIYGISTNSVILQHGRIRRNQFLADIFRDEGIEPSKIQTLNQAAKGVIDMRRIKAGKEYVLYRETDSTSPPKVFVYKDNPIDEYAFYFEDSIMVEHIRNPVDTVWRTLTGTIKNSLYVTLLDLDANLDLVHKLSEIYAWEIDFFHLDMNDQFKIVYDELFVNGKSVGIHRVHAAEFIHRGSPFLAFHYPVDHKEDYFNEDGESLRKTFLKAPLKYSRISSRYSGRRYHPVLKRYKSHRGTDYAAPRGTPIYSVGDGVISEARYAKYNGNFVKIRHNSVYSTQYLHMSKIKRGIRPGKVVKQGEVIGYVGSTGLANGPHCCFRFWKNGYQVNPMRQKIPPTKPVPPEKFDDFLVYIIPLRKDLRKINYPEDKIFLDTVLPEIASPSSPVIRSAKP
jgi:murein DD-endopeptidase MepM/ murein hydrolase activator NlpD